VDTFFNEKTLLQNEKNKIEICLFITKKQKKLLIAYPPNYNFKN